jgi:hypothetical protein
VVVVVVVVVVKRNALHARRVLVAQSPRLNAKRFPIT